MNPESYCPPVLFHPTVKLYHNSLNSSPIYIPYSLWLINSDNFKYFLFLQVLYIIEGSSHNSHIFKREVFWECKPIGKGLFRLAGDKSIIPNACTAHAPHRSLAPIGLSLESLIYTPGHSSVFILV